MFAKDIMTTDFVCCNPDTSLRDVARLMLDHDCGAIPVVETGAKDKVAGIVTDRDIVCRALAQGQDPFQMRAGDCMSRPILTVRQDAAIEECMEAMERGKIRRIVVVDDYGRCCGIISQADIARHCPREAAGEVVRAVSESTEYASAVH